MCLTKASESNLYFGSNTKDEYPTLYQARPMGIWREITAREAYPATDAHTPEHRLLVEPFGPIDAPDFIPAQPAAHAADFHFAELIPLRALQ